MARILLGVTGGIAAYKALELVRRLLAHSAQQVIAVAHVAVRRVGVL